MQGTRLMLLGAGELGKELTIAAKRLGLRVVAVDRYEGAPAMQVADRAEVMSLLDPTSLEGVVRTHRPDYIVPETEAVSTEKLAELEAEGFFVTPGHRPVALTVDREATRRLVRDTLGLRMPAYAIAESEDELRDACDLIGYPCVAKPVVGSMGRGQSVVSGPARVERAWEYARVGTPGEEVRLVVEEYVDFHTEITLLALRQRDGRTLFLNAVAHRNEDGVFHESWIPAAVSPARLAEAREAARRIVDHLGGIGLFGVELFVTAEDVLVSEVVPRPHVSGLVTLVSQDLSQFELHLRSLLGLPVPTVRYHGPAACAAILSPEAGRVTGYEGVERALEVPGSQLLLFGKSEAYRRRRMGVTLAMGPEPSEARSRALEAAARVEVRVHGRSRHASPGDR